MLGGDEKGFAPTKNRMIFLRIKSFVLNILKTGINI